MVPDSCRTNGGNGNNSADVKRIQLFLLFSLEFGSCFGHFNVVG